MGMVTSWLSVFTQQDFVIGTMLTLFFGFPQDSFFMNLDSVIIFLMCIVSIILAIPHVRNLIKREAPKELLKYTICEK